jgi:hypothetical protein
MRLERWMPQLSPWQNTPNRLSSFSLLVEGRVAPTGPGADRGVDIGCICGPPLGRQLRSGVRRAVTGSRRCPPMGVGDVLPNDPLLAQPVVKAVRRGPPGGPGRRVNRTVPDLTAGDQR